MKPKDVRLRVTNIVTLAIKDYEAAHSAEDTLHQDVLKAIADGSPHAPALAREALRTQEIKFPRLTA